MLSAASGCFRTSRLYRSFVISCNRRVYDWAVAGTLQVIGLSTDAIMPLLIQ